MTADRSRVCSTAPFGMAPRVTALVGRSYSLSAASRSLFSYTWEGTWSSVVKPGILGLNPIWERHCRHEQLVLSARLLSRSGCRWPACPGRTPTGTPEPSGSEKPSALKMDTSSTILRMLDSADMNSRHHRLTFHDLRGTAVTRMAEAGCTVLEIAAITGHSLRDANAILDHYLARTESLTSATIAKLDRADRERKL
jgi:hypothetical protein